MHFLQNIVIRFAWCWKCQMSLLKEAWRKLVRLRKNALNPRREIVTLALYPSLSTVWLRYFQKIRMFSYPPNTNLKIIVHVLNQAIPRKRKVMVHKGVKYCLKKCSWTWGLYQKWESSWMKTVIYLFLSNFILFDTTWSNCIPLVIN